MGVQIEVGDLMRQVVESEAVQRAIAEAGRARLQRVRLLANKAGRVHMAASLRVDVGMRPGKGTKDGWRRPYARIISEVSTEELTDDNRAGRLSRTQVMRRSR